MNDSFQGPEGTLPFLPHNRVAPSTYLFLQLVLLLLGFLQLQLQFLDLPNVSSRLVRQRNATRELRLCWETVPGNPFFPWVGAI